MEIPPVAAVSFEVLSPLASGTSFQDGRILHAKVQAMLSDTLARLTIDGQTVDVTASKPLPIGATLTLKAEWKDGQMTLITQGAVKAPPSRARSAPLPPRIPAPLLDPLKVALTKIQTMAVEAMLAGTGSAESALPQSAAVAESGGQRQAASQSAAGAPAHKIQNAAYQAELLDSGSSRGPAAGGKAASTVDAAGAAQAHGSSAAQPVLARADHAVSYTLEIPFYFPGSAAPLRLEVSRDDEPDGQEGRPSHSPSWMVRFAVEPGSLGRIHAAISLIDGHIGVHLWAEQGDTAEWFKQHSPQLRDALVASDLALDSVWVGQGQPMAEN